jgi:hypothetical protein
MDKAVLVRRAISTCLCVIVFTAYSMVGLAANGKIAGELVISGGSGDSAAVLVNGEPARSGRSIFSSSTITTPENTSAIINTGKAGRIELAPNSTFVVTFDEGSIKGDLMAGKLTVLSSAAPVNITTANGKTASVNAGEAVNASGQAQDDDATTGGGSNWWIYAIILGGAVAGIIVATTQANNRVDLGGDGTVVSPTR